MEGMPMLETLHLDSIGEPESLGFLSAPSLATSLRHLHLSFVSMYCDSVNDLCPFVNLCMLQIEQCFDLCVEDLRTLRPPSKQLPALKKFDYDAIRRKGIG